MPIAILQDWAVSDRSTANYDALVERTGVRANAPAGLVFHTAGFADDQTWRIFDVWESQADYDRFMQERLMPAMGDFPTSGGPPSATVTYELHGYQGH